MATDDSGWRRARRSAAKQGTLWGNEKGRYSYQISWIIPI